MASEQGFPAGHVLGGKWRVERTLGVGGFGVVVAALHLQLEERVAIKILLPESAKNPAAAERFVREAKAAVRIRSEHVCRVTDVGVFPPEEAGVSTPYMVMEYLEGSDLSSLVKTRGPQAVSDAAEWILQACEAIAEAHTLGIVHRDLKPANLFLTHKVDGSPSVKVLDFGISKVASAQEGDKGMTKSSDVMGSPYYMSPEQMRSTRGVDHRADIWALGTILYEVLAGQPPFDGETMTALIVNIMQEPPRDIRQRRRDIPPGMIEIIGHCLQKDAGLRFQDVGQLASALSNFAPARAQQSLSRTLAALSGRTSSMNPISGQPASGPNAHAISGGAARASSQNPISQNPISGGYESTMPPSSPYGHGALHAARSSAPVAPTLLGDSHPDLANARISAGIAGASISNASLSGSSGRPSPTLLNDGAPAATQMGANPAWAGTMSGQRPSRGPLVVGVVALLAIAGAAGTYLVLKKPGEVSSQGIVAMAPTGDAPAVDLTQTANAPLPTLTGDAAPTHKPSTPANNNNNNVPHTNGGKPSAAPSVSAAPTTAPEPLVTHHPVVKPPDPIPQPTVTPQPTHKPNCEPFCGAK